MFSEDGPEGRRLEMGEVGGGAPTECLERFCVYIDVVRVGFFFFFSRIILDTLIENPTPYGRVYGVPTW